MDHKFYYNHFPSADVIQVSRDLRLHWSHGNAVTNGCQISLSVLFQGQFSNILLHENRLALLWFVFGMCCFYYCCRALFCSNKAILLLQTHHKWPRKATGFNSVDILLHHLLRTDFWIWHLLQYQKVYQIS